MRKKRMKSNVGQEKTKHVVFKGYMPIYLLSFWSNLILLNWYLSALYILIGFKLFCVTGFQMWDQMAEKGTKKGPILANLAQKSIKGTNLNFKGPNWTHCKLISQ